ncbi:hypothetical protein BDN70DRAFT_870675 [Pholiota conissans]|uniref:O-fucosyltransferase family protein n=1 Tax=Pholiota conissans TaxID=109636 RepID=A0A9P5ZFN6_9AGAR|nr:hypothetical protein BDN70DRAFT_870675 [Pholiota conissans]
MARLLFRGHISVWVLMALLILVSFTLFYSSNDTASSALFSGPSSSELDDLADYPPSYRDIRKLEQSLPQHNLDLPFPEGRNGRYVRFSCQIQQLGWNNVLNELLMNNFLAYKSNRGYVFADYVWKTGYYPWPMLKAIEWPPRTPLSALISGPTVGGPWPENDPAPRSISEAWWEVVCPPERRRIIYTREVKPKVADLPGDQVFAAWQKVLLDAPESCIEIQGVDQSEDGYSQVFDLWLWGTSRVLSLWDSFSKSPVSTHLGASHVVERTLEQNKRLFHADEQEVGVIDPYDRMLAIHLRRGDFKEACIMLSDWHSTFYSWNLHEFLPDKFSPPEGGTWGKNSPENEKLVLEHCLPSDDAILKKIRDSRTDYIEVMKKKGGKAPVIDVLYILTNDNSEWLSEVKRTMKNDGWRVVTTSRDLTLDIEGKDVGMAVDMEIARKASVFIGNGWSSFTSNILHRRLVDGKIPISNRFY